MTPDTLFRAAPEIEASSLDEARTLTEAAHYSSVPTYAEELGVRYRAEEKEFEAEFSEGSARFSKEGFFKFCGAVGLPRAFVEKAPSQLLETSINQFLEGNQKRKLKLILRGANIVAAMKASQAWLNPVEVLNQLQDLALRDLILQRVVVTDDGIVANALPSPTCSFDVTVDDPYDLGVRLDYGHQRSGLLQSGFVTRRRACGNICQLTSSSRELRSAFIYERAGRGQLSESFSRFHSRLIEPKAVVELIRNSHVRLPGQLLTDVNYLPVFNRVNKLVGKEPALGIFETSEDEHNNIVQVVKAKKSISSMQNTPIEPTKLEQFELYKLFNKLTSVAQAYKGVTRLELEACASQLLAT